MTPPVRTPRTVGPPVPARRREQLEAFVAGQHTTEHVVRQVEAEGLELVDIVQMDEFTLDLVVRVDPSLWLVYDTT